MSKPSTIKPIDYIIGTLGIKHQTISFKTTSIRSRCASNIGCEQQLAKFELGREHHPMVCV